MLLLWSQKQSFPFTKGGNSVSFASSPRMGGLILLCFTRVGQPQHILALIASNKNYSVLCLVCVVPFGH